VGSGKRERRPNYGWAAEPAPQGPAERTAGPATIIREFLQHITGSAAQPKIPDTLEEASTQLLVRIGTPFAKGMKALPWYVDIPGAGGCCSTWSSTSLIRWLRIHGEDQSSSRSPQEWLQIAFDNLQSVYAAELARTAARTRGVYGCHTNDSYYAARASSSSSTPRRPPHGWLIAIPARDWLFAMKAEVRA